MLAREENRVTDRVHVADIVSHESKRHRSQHVVEVHAVHDVSAGSRDKEMDLRNPLAGAVRQRGNERFAGVRDDLRREGDVDGAWRLGLALSHASRILAAAPNGPKRFASRFARPS